MHPAAPLSSAPLSDPLAVLRRATRAHHERIDALIDLPQLSERSHYARVLQAFAAFLAGWEPAIAAALAPGWEPWLRARSRRRFLQDDLAHLGVGAPAAAALPQAAWSCPAAAWGSVYVMEGSALGGQLISRQLAAAGLRPDRGAAYFHGWGDATGALWRETRTVLAAQLAAPAALAQACEGARSTFDALSGLLAPHAHERAALV